MQLLETIKGKVGYNNLFLIDNMYLEEFGDRFLFKVGRV